VPKSALPFLIFQGDGVAAVDFYLSTFPGAVAETIERHESGPRAGTLKMARLILAGQTIMMNDSPPIHSFTFTPSISFFVECSSDAELRELSEKLKQGGAEMMPVGSYGFSRLFTWVSDRFGVSWQLNVS
jgi:predicted 3-demethylubiquinone-9 3-methyltransferase (glyoxalase superfamily)